MSSTIAPIVGDTLGRMKRVVVLAILLGVSACREAPGKAEVDAGPKGLHLDFAETHRGAIPADVGLSGDFGKLEVMAKSGAIVFDVVGKEGTHVALEGAKVTPHAGGRVTVEIDVRPLLLDAPANAAAEPGPAMLAKDLPITVTEPGAAPRNGTIHVDAGRYVSKGFRLLLDDVARGKPLEGASPSQAARSLVYVTPGGDTVQHAGKVVPLRAVDLVAHGRLGAPRKGPKCTYPRPGVPAATDEWPRIEHDLEVTVRLANDGSTLASKTFSSADVPCPATVSRGQLVVRVMPDEAPVRAWLASLVARD